MISAASVLLDDHSVRVKQISGLLYERLAALGCIPYVKTIYIGFTLSGELVAALYPHADHVELALALPEDFGSSLLVDATHLTWKTMPVAALLRTPADAKAALPLVAEAHRRVEDGTHDVDLPNEHFMGRQRTMTSRNLLGDKAPAKAISPRRGNPGGASSGGVAT